MSNVLIAGMPAQVIREQKENTIDNFSANNNCLNLIRIIAARQVMFGHMVEHLELPITGTFFQITYFLRGVPIFL